MTKRAILVGAGIGGLTAALALRARGFDVTVVEREPELAKAGAGLQLGPNALRPLFALGLEGALRQAGAAPEAAEVRRGADGALLHLTPYADAERRWGAPYLQLARADLQAILLAAVADAGIALRLGAPVAGATGAGEVAFASGAREAADLVVGADGLRSRVAAALFGVAVPVIGGRSAWRALVPAERLPPALLAPRTQVRIGGGRHLVTYPLRDGSVLNLVAVTSGGASGPEAWTQRGDAAALARLFAGWAEPVPTLLAALDDGQLWRGVLHDRPPLRRWTRGRVALLGDAAHPMSPSFAQGAAMAVEDAAALAQAVAAEGVPDGLAAYARARRGRVARVQAQSRRNGRLFHLPAPVSAGLFRAAAARDRGDPLARFDWLYGGGPVPYRAGVSFETPLPGA